MDRLWIILLFALGALPVDASSTGRAAAAKYFSKDVRQLKRAPAQSSSIRVKKTSSSSTKAKSSPFKGSHRLGLTGGAYMESQKSELGAGWGFALDYQDVGLPTDFLVHGYHLGLHSFEQAGKTIQNLSFLWSFRFPKEHLSPLYVGLAVGPGYFVKQTEESSWLSITGRGFLGLRLAQKRSQFFIEAGINNHYLVLSRGHYENWFINSGVSFTF